MDNFKGYCDTCAFAGLKAPNICALSGLLVSKKSYCGEHRNSIETCDICGKVIIPARTVIDNGHLICDQCAEYINTCITCKNKEVCTFQTDPSPIPPAIQKQVRQGNMVTVTQVPNPERIRITCQNGCKCYSEQNGCIKQTIGFCNNQEVLYND